MDPQSRRSRAYPAIPLQEAVDLLVQTSALWNAGNRDTLAKALGYSNGKSGIGARKIAALVHFGLLKLEKGLYSPTDLARRALASRHTAGFQDSLREACLSPVLFREILYRCEPLGRVPRPLSLTLRQDHGIQERAAEEVARIFMASAVYAGILERDGSFRESFDEARHSPLPGRPEQAPPPAAAPIRESLSGNSESPKWDQVLKFPLTDQKKAEIRLSARLNEEDIELLQMQLDFLKAQVRLSRPDQPVRLDLYRGDRRK